MFFWEQVHDLSLLKTSERMRFSETVQPIPIGKNIIGTADFAITSGFGVEEVSETFHFKLNLTKILDIILLPYF